MNGVISEFFTAMLFTFAVLIILSSIKKKCREYIKQGA